MYAMLLVRMARSSAYAMVLHVVVDVLKWYPMLSFSSHRRSRSKKRIKKHEEVTCENRRNNVR